MKHIITCLGLLIASSILPSQAAMISIVPANNATTVGQQLVIDLAISGLGDNQANSLSIFDIDVMFDDQKLVFQQATFGDQLDLAGFGSWQLINQPSAGIVNLFELSFDDIDTLDTLQAGSFVLVSMVFDVIDNGVATLFSQVNSLGDAYGIELTNIELVNAQIVVPEPSISVVMALGLLMVFRCQRSLSRKN